VIQLVGLIQLHKWRLLLLFQALDVDQSGEVDLFEFEWLWAFATVGGRLASKPLLQDEAELMLLESEIDAATDNDDSNDNTNAAFDLEALEEAHEKLQEKVDEQIGKCYDQHMIILQMSSMANLAVVAALADADWHGNSTLFKVMLAGFPLAWAIEFAYVLFYGPTLDVLQHPDKAVSQRASVLVLLFGVAGSVLMMCDQTHELTSANTQHALASSTVFMFITRNLYFSRMVLAFGRVMIRCLPLVSAIFMFMLLFGQASKDLFGTKVADMNGDMYFDTNSHALITLFRLFTSAAWYTVMLRAAAATTEAALIWFLMYILLVTMFCCELFVGVIISEFVEIHSIKSPRLFNALEPIFEFGPTEREAVLAGLLQLNRKMQPYNRAFFAVLENGPSSLRRDRQLPVAQIAVPKRLHNSISELFPAVLTQLLATNEAEKTRVHNEYQIARHNDEGFQPHISQCVPALMMVLGHELVSVTKMHMYDPNSWEEMSRQHRNVVKQWLIGFIAAMCTEGITDHFNLTKHGAQKTDQKTQVLEHFQHFASTRQMLSGAAEWNRVCNACHKAVDKIFDLYHGDSWLEPNDAQTAHICTKQLCTLLALDELVRLGEVFYQQAASEASTELTMEEALEASEWHRPFIWGMRMYQVMKTVRNGTSLEQVVSTTIDEIMAAATESGVDLSNSTQLAEFTKSYASQKNPSIPTHAQFGAVQFAANPLAEPEVELHEMKTDVTHALSSDRFELPEVDEPDAQEDETLADDLKQEVVAGLFFAEDDNASQQTSSPQLADQVEGEMVEDLPSLAEMVELSNANAEESATSPLQVEAEEGLSELDEANREGVAADGAESVEADKEVEEGMPAAHGEETMNDEPDEEDPTIVDSLPNSSVRERRRKILERDRKKQELTNDLYIEI